MARPEDDVTFSSSRTLQSPLDVVERDRVSHVRIEEAPSVSTLPEGVGDTLVAPSMGSLEGLPPASAGGSRLKVVAYQNYAVEAEVARGGIGRILRARDIYLNRPVALKEMLRHDAATQERFVREARITARLQHPSIVPVYEAGKWPSGEPFYAMKLVTGQSFDRTMEDARTLDQRLALLPHVIAVAEAMAYAHNERIVHRDLKPQNVLSGPFGETVVIDWGLAKDLTSEQPELPVEGPNSMDVGLSPALTMAGAIVGTPAYMPPEQADGRVVDERADVYAIGAILYHLLAGRPPYDGSRALDILRAVIAGPPEPIEVVQPGVPRDLATIVHKAMAHKRSLRYRTAAELAEDLRRFQTGQIVGAHHYSRRERLLRFSRKNSRVLLVVATATLVLLVAMAASIQRIVAARDDARKERDRAASAETREAERADRLTLVSARAAALTEPLESLAWLKTLSPSFRDARRARLVAADAISRGIPRLLRGHTMAINRNMFSPDGKLIATSSDDHDIRLWDVSSGTSRVLSGFSDEVWAIQFSPDSRLVVGGSKDGHVRAFDIVDGAASVLVESKSPIDFINYAWNRQIVIRDYSGQNYMVDPVQRIKNPLYSPKRLDKAINSGVLSSDGKILVVGADGMLVFIDLATGRVRQIPGEPQQMTAVALSDDNEWVVTGNKVGGVRLWDLRKGTSRLLEGHKDSVRRVRFLPRQHKVVTAGRDGVIQMFDIETGQTRVFLGHEGAIYSMVISHDGKTIASGGADHTARLWDVVSGTSRVFRGPTDAISSLDFSPNDDHFIASSYDGSLRLYSFDVLKDRILAAHDQSVTMLVVSPDGQSVGSASEDGTVFVTNQRDGKTTNLGKFMAPITGLDFSPDGKRVAIASTDQRVAVVPAAGGDAAYFAGNHAGVHSVVFAPDGSFFVSAGMDGSVRRFPTGGGESRVLMERQVAAFSLAISKDGSSIAAGFADGALVLLNLQDGRETPLVGHHDRVSALAFSPSGKWLGSGSVDHSVRLWDAKTGQSIHSIDAAGTGITALMFFPDETKFATLGGEANVRIWSTADGHAENVLRGHRGVVGGVSISPDGKRIVTASVDGTARLWDLEIGDSRVLDGHKGLVSAITFADEGRVIVSGGKDHTVRRFMDDLPTELGALRESIEKATPETVSSLGAHADDHE